MLPITMKPLGDTGICIQMGDRIHPDIHLQVRSYCWYLEHFPIKGLIEWIPTYTAVSIFYHPNVIRYKELSARLERIMVEMEQVSLPPARVITLPTWYGEEAGPDLRDVAEYNHLTIDEVINIHTEPAYLIYMMGFTPGFPYLGGMSEGIATPRLANPRSVIPAGSVGIAGAQTGVYPMKTPGGWRLIGRTPVRLYDLERAAPVLLKAGDYVKFTPIDKEEFKHIEEQVAQGTYRIEREPYPLGGENDGISR
jgi:inhibitor of KinA